MPFRHSLSLPTWIACALLALLTACAGPGTKAPVEARPAAGSNRAPVGAPGSLPATPGVAPDGSLKPPPPGAENAGKPGYYTVKPGDTLIRIGLENGQNWRELMRWNNLDNPNLIEVGQVLRVVPPAVDTNAAAARAVAMGKVEARPLDGKPAVPPAGASAPTAPASAASAPVATNEEDDITWSWPAAGPVAAGFEEGRSKGLVITGKAGDPVLAAADGRVVYASSGLRGYGNLVIIKHNNTYLTAYAHNQALLVKEDQAVRRGQKIAEMGSSDAERVQLHFEVRRLGKPVDPARLLPAR